MPKITVIDYEGNEHEITATAGETLMESLRDADLVEATCGGAASCGTCHIYVRDNWAGRLDERTEDEGYMLEALEGHIEVRATSRLACQITLSEDHDGLTLDIAPEI